MKTLGRAVAQLGVSVVASTTLCSSLAAGPAVDFQVVSLRDVPQFQEPVYVAIRNREELLSFYRRGDELPSSFSVPGQLMKPSRKYPVPDIDFDKYSLLVVAIDARTGYSLSVERIFDRGDELWVQIEIIGPGKDCAVAQIVSHPYLTILIPHITKPVRFNASAATRVCTGYTSTAEMRGLLGNENNPAHP